MLKKHALEKYDKIDKQLNKGLLIFKKKSINDLTQIIIKD